MQTQKGVTGGPEVRSNHLPELNWNQIDEPGSYIIVATGELVRVPQEGVFTGHSPLIKITGRKEVRVAKLSDNPAEPISVLRSVAADNDYFVNF